MRFARRLGAGILLIVGSVAFLIAFFLALASLLQVGSDDTRIESEAVESGPATGRNDLESSSQGEPIDAPPAGPLASIPYQLDGSEGTVSCFPAASGTPGGSFVVQVVSSTPVPDSMVVGIDLVASDGSRQRQAVTIPTHSDQGEVAVVVPDPTSSDGAGPFVDCSIAAIQKGQRVILTGS